MNLKLIYSFIYQVVQPTAVVEFSGVVQLDDLFTLVLLFACFVIFILGWILGLLFLQV